MRVGQRVLTARPDRLRGPQVTDSGYGLNPFSCYASREDSFVGQTGYSARSQFRTVDSAAGPSPCPNGWRGHGERRP